MKELKKTRYYITHSLLLLGLTFCGFNSVGGALLNQNHACEYGEWEIVKEATCAEGGEAVRYCQIDPTHTQKKITEASGAHNYEDFVCTACGLTQVSKGLSYQQTLEGYEVTEATEEELSDGEVSIPAEIDGVPVVSISSYAFYGKHSLKKVKIPDTVTHIGSEAFADCSDLTKVVMGNSVTSMGEQVFRNCSSLTSVTLPDSLTEISNGTFASCYNLSEVQIPETLTGIGDYAFYDCKELESVVIPETVTEIGAQAFYCCPLTSIELLNPEVILGDSAFYGSAPKKIVVPASALVNLGNTYNLEEVVVTVGNAEIPVAVFSGASCLKSITLPFVGAQPNTTENSSYQYPFGYIFGSSRYNNSTATEQYHYSGSLSSTAKSTYYIPKSLQSVTITGGEILLGAFYNCSNLTSITIPETIRSIGNVAFYHCTGLESISLGDNLTSIGARAFEGCNGLTSVTLPDSVTSIGEMAFMNCSGLESLTLGKSVTNVFTEAFYGCSGLASVTIPSSVKYIGYGAFKNCILLTNVTFESTGVWWHSTSEEGESKTLIRKTDLSNRETAANYLRQTYSSHYWFHNEYAKGLAYTLLGNNTYAVTGMGTCTDAHLYIPDEYNGLPVTEIGEGAFESCTFLVSVMIPDGVTTINESAFRDCANLTGVRIPASLTSIDAYAFYNCSRLSSITIPASVTLMERYVFTNCSRLTIYCDAQSKPSTWNNDWNSSERPVYWAGVLDTSTYDGSSFAKAKFVSTGTHDVVIDEAGENVYFQFIPTTTKTYTIRSNGNKDTYGYLYNASQTQLAANDDGAGGLQFSISYTLNAGQTYYIVVKMLSSSTTGSFTITIS